MMVQLDIEKIIAALKVCCPHQGRPIGLHEPTFCGNEWAYLKDCLDSTYVSYVGEYVTKFEAMLEDFTGVRKAVAVVNGTSALHVALKLAGVEINDEVFVPALTFIATANAVNYCGAVPHFVDSEASTLGLDSRKLREYLKNIATITNGVCLNRFTGRRIKAVVPVHAFGTPVDIDPLVEVCEEYNLEMIEDAAESLGSYYKGRHTGNWGKLAILSFNGNKTITTGGGGAVLTNDLELGMKAKHWTSTAKVPHPWEYRHDFIGYNYRLPNINAALGCAQMEMLPKFLERKRQLAHRYLNAFKDVEGVKVFEEPPYARSNYWLNVILLDEVFADRRDEVLKKTNDQGFKTRPAWNLLNTLDVYKRFPAMDLSCAETLARRLINIPSSPSL